VIVKIKISFPKHGLTTELQNASSQVKNRLMEVEIGTQLTQPQLSS